MNDYTPSYSTYSSKWSFYIERIMDEPIITDQLHPLLTEETKAFGYTNINGPTLIRVPDWVQNKLGNYYLYFSHHQGPQIRMAYADTLTGPWTLYETPVLHLSQSTMTQETEANSGLSDLLKLMTLSEAQAMIDISTKAKEAYEILTQSKLSDSPPTTPHIASPEIFIDEPNKTLRLYFHGVVSGSIQMTKLALSKDGLSFEAREEILGSPYMRTFQHQNEFYGFAMPGILYKSPDGLAGFKPRKKWIFDTDVRHSGLLKLENQLFIFYSRVGDAPERILYSHMDISSTNWNDWKASDPQELLQPNLKWEGAEEENTPSLRGEIGVRVNQLRDPHIFQDTDDQLYLTYTGGGEFSIGIVRLEMSAK